MAFSFNAEQPCMLASLLLAGVVACSGPSACCTDNYPVTHALLYGAVRDSAGHPAPGVLVRAGDALGVVTDDAGRYRLATVLHGLTPGMRTIPVVAYRTDPVRGLVDSSRVEAMVPFFKAEPPQDSVRVDFVTSWVP